MLLAARLRSKAKSACSPERSNASAFSSPARARFRCVSALSLAIVSLFRASSFSAKAIFFSFRAFSALSLAIISFFQASYFSSKAVFLASSAFTA
jgi:hypothetical protein